MILKIIIVAAILLLLYRLLGGRFPQITMPKRPNVSGKSEQARIEEDTLIECEKCGTFVTLKEAVIIKGKTYCSKQCAGL